MVENSTFDFRRELGYMTPLVAQGAKVFVYGCGNNYEYICKQYRFLLGIELDSYIDGYIDKNKKGTYFHGKQVVSIEEMSERNVIILISVASFELFIEIGSRLTDLGFINRHSFFGSEIFFNLIMKWESRRISGIKDVYKGKRCFIVGNGPSLRVDDLDKIKNEYSFASNKIYKIFDKTMWRPDYYVICDAIYLRESLEEIKSNIKCPIFYAFNTVFEMKDFRLEDGYFFFEDGRIEWMSDLDNMMFSDLPSVMYWGGNCYI